VIFARRQRLSSPRYRLPTRDTRAEQAALLAARAACSARCPEAGY